MASVFTLSLIAFVQVSISQSDQQKYCPSTDWILCGTEKNDCVIQPGVKSTTISYGLNQDQQSSFVFWDVSNSNATQQFRTACYYKNLGDPWNGEDKGCCFQNNEEINNVSPSDGNWKQIASENDDLSTNKRLAYIRFGLDGQYVYRWMFGSFKCSDDWFPDVYKGNTKICAINTAVNTSSYGASTFIPCGSSSGGGECNTNIVPNGESISLIQYGAAPNWVYSYGYNSENEVPCNGAMFVNGGLGNGYCNIHNATIFPPGVVGVWTEVDSCDGCAHLDESITEGTTSTSTQATTTTWSKSLSETVSEGLIFEKVSLTYSVGYSVSNMVEESYSYSSSHQCDAQCGNGTKANWYMYQWQMNAQEYQKADVAAFNIFTCVWVCNTEQQLPKCPPGYCKDFACQTCLPYNSN